jgi:hypothetical protein
MANFKNGEISWADTSFDSTKKTAGKDVFLRLVPGSNVVRLLTLPYQYYQHRHEIQGGKKYGYRINCSGANGSCAICEMGADHKPKRRWLFGSIDRKTGQYKILDINFSVLKSIQTYQKDEEWGDPSRYDIDIVVDPNGGSVGYYTVVAKPSKPLSAADLVLKEENGVDELLRRSTPPDPSKVVERLDKIMEEIKASGGGGNTAAQKNGTVNSSAASDDDDDDGFFKNHDTAAKH